MASQQSIEEMTLLLKEMIKHFLNRELLYLLGRLKNTKLCHYSTWIKNHSHLHFTFQYFIHL